MKIRLFTTLILLVVFVCLKSDIPSKRPTTCSYTNTSTLLGPTAGPGAVSLTEVNGFGYCYHGSSNPYPFDDNPYTQAQWEAGIKVGELDCLPEKELCATAYQSWGGTMRVVLKTNGDVYIKCMPGTTMPSICPPMYVVNMHHIPFSEDCSIPETE